MEVEVVEAFAVSYSLHCVNNFYGWGQNILFEGGGLMAIARGMSSAVARAYSGVWGYAPIWVQGQSPWSVGWGVKPREADSNLKTKWAILRSIWLFHLLVVTDISSIPKTYIGR